jgi:sugar/nucleoside kinase (ribokinase family)
VRDEIAERLGRPGRTLDIIGYGECSIDEVWVLPTAPDWGGKLRASRRERLGGGQVATAMVACARLGLRAGFCGIVGDDDEGQEALAGLAEEGVDVAAARKANGATRAALILVDGRNGERAVVECGVPRAGHGHGVHQVPARVAEARILHLDATDPPFAKEAARQAREAGTVVSLDVDHPAPGLDELLPLADVVVMSRGLPQQLTGEEELERALRKLAERVPGGLVGCTLGADGAALLDDDHLLLSPAFPAERVVDTTACGDTFRAALLVALAEGQRPADGLRFANAAASLKTRDLGRRGCPVRAEVNALMARW